MTAPPAPDPQLTDELANPESDESRDPLFDETGVPAVATNIKIGDTLNTLGATLIDTNTSLMSGRFRAGYTGAVTQPIDLRTNAMGPWIRGLSSGAWATWMPGDVNNTSSGPYPQMSALPSNGELEVYLNADGVAALGNDVLTIANGVITIQPRPMNAMEKLALQVTATANRANGFPNPPPQTWMSAAVCSAPYCLKPPYLFGAQVAIPADIALGGRWPAIWQLPLPQVWPPENDTLEAVPQGMTSSVHDTSIANSGTTTVWAALAAYAGKSVFYLSVVYPDLVSTFVGATLATAKCVAQFPTPADWANTFFYNIINYAIGGPGSWSGPLPAGTTAVAPMTIGAVVSYAMPATYPGPAVVIPPPSAGQAVFTRLEADMAALKSTMGWT
jgi:hypothetical protein